MSPAWQVFVIAFDPCPVPLTGLRLGFAEVRFSLAYKSLLPGTVLHAEQTGLDHTVVRRPNGRLALDPPLPRLNPPRRSSSPPERQPRKQGARSSARALPRARISAEPRPRPRKTRQVKRLPAL